MAYKTRHEIYYFRSYNIVFKFDNNGVWFEDLDFLLLYICFRGCSLVIPV